MTAPDTDTLIALAREGRIAVVPVEAEQPMLEAGEVALVDVLRGVDYFMPEDGMSRVLQAAIAAAPTLTPALLALAEERDRLREALKPFGEAAALWENCADDSDIWTRNLSLSERIKAGLTVSMLRRARALT